MKTDIFNRILVPILNQFMNIDFDFENKSLSIHNIDTKERIDTIHNMQIVIYSNDHNPPHFHVFSNDKKIDAKFTIERCELLSGTISRKETKRIEAFYNHPKTKLVMERIWEKRNK